MTIDKRGERGAEGCQDSRDPSRIHAVRDQINTSAYGGHDDDEREDWAHQGECPLRAIRTPTIAGIALCHCDDALC